MGTLKRLRQRIARTPLRQVLVRYRLRQVRPTDVVVASYPRAGSTWLRFLLYELLSGEPATFPAVNERIPDLGTGHAARLLPDGGRLIKTHELHHDVYRRGIYLVRDVRDIVVSEYHYQLKVGRFAGHLDTFIPEFVAGSVNSYGSWQDHVASWLDSTAALADGLCVVRYEDLNEDAAAVLARIVGFLAVEADRARLDAVVRNNSLRRMREKEEAVQDSLFRRTQDDEPFVRKGLTGGWRETLTPGQIEVLESACGSALERLGYRRAGARAG